MGTKNVTNLAKHSWIGNWKLSTKKMTFNRSFVGLISNLKVVSEFY